MGEGAEGRGKRIPRGSLARCSRISQLQVQVGVKHQKLRWRLIDKTCGLHIYVYMYMHTSTNKYMYAHTHPDIHTTYTLIYTHYPYTYTYYTYHT